LAPNDLATLVSFTFTGEGVLAGSFIGGIILLSLVAIIGGFLHSRRERLLMHAERMKALELGRELPDDQATARLKAVCQAEESASEPGEPRSLASKCFSMTSGVCGAGFVFAWMGSENQAVAIAIASATGAIGVTGMICGTILASKPTESREMRMAAHVVKPRFDPEAV
jgi:hypothetical protein